MRGKLLEGEAIPGYKGITPARAGKTTTMIRNPSGTRDHPRACGENLAVMVLAVRSVGSPPRVRGKREEGIATFVGKRITPARAGKTRQHRGSADRRPDHPRACGENVTSSAPSAAIVGSPPRVRGKLENLQEALNETGITPARAGKTSIRRTRRTPATDHPRACGENVQRLHDQEVEKGSPPRVRGKPCNPKAGWRAMRITPARAGKTCAVPPLAPMQGDHPCACGENIPERARQCNRAGSPPRVRGKHRLLSPTAFLLRITPARAGKTFSTQVLVGKPKDHPRACGENAGHSPR